MYYSHHAGEELRFKELIELPEVIQLSSGRAGIQTEIGMRSKCMFINRVSPKGLSGKGVTLGPAAPVVQGGARLAVFTLSGARAAPSLHTSTLLLRAEQMEGPECVCVSNTAGAPGRPPVLLAGLGHSHGAARGIWQTHLGSVRGVSQWPDGATEQSQMWTQRSCILHAELQDLAFNGAGDALGHNRSWPSGSASHL